MEDSNDKSSNRLQRRILRRRINYAVTITFLSLLFYVMTLIHGNTNTNKSNRVATTEWKIRRALHIMKQREADSHDNSVISDAKEKDSHSNYNILEHRHHHRENERPEQYEHNGMRGDTRHEDERMHHGNDPMIHERRKHSHDRFDGMDHFIDIEEHRHRRKTITPPPIKLNATHPHKWIDAKLLPRIPDDGNNNDDKIKSMIDIAMENIRHEGRKKHDFKVDYEDEKDEHKQWEQVMNEHSNQNEAFFKPKVDYRTDVKYVYPKVIMSPPTEGGYPQLQPLDAVLKEWPQDDIDLQTFGKDNTMKEVLLHFDYSNTTERNAAIRFRDKELPFKVYNVPEIDSASEKWTDDYVSQEFENSIRGVTAKGHCQQSENNYFAFFRNNHWDVESMGSPPTMDNDWGFRQWSNHAKYADFTSIPFYQRHYYWQSGAQHGEIHSPFHQSFISADLPSFSSAENNFFSFHTDDQKGIQCRFGERGVTAATHYDAGRNMVAMIKGSKRYILSPPKSCSKLGIVNEKQHPVFRHSLLNFAHINLSKEQTIGMSNEEREWLQRAASAPSLSTVLNQGEVLYIPSHWFHYITSLQKSAQCNVRSGRDVKGSEEFGGLKDVELCGDNRKEGGDFKMGRDIFDNHY